MVRGNEEYTKKFEKRKREKNVYKKGAVHINKGVQGRTYIKLIKLVGFEKNEKVFDAGCANGILAKYLKNVILVGGDLNVDNGKKIQGYYKVFKCDIEEKIPLKDNSVDTVISISVFQYLDNIDIAFRECMRIARKRVIIWSPNSKLLKLRYFFNPSKTKTTNYLDTKVLINLGKRYNLNAKIIYISNRLHNLRKIFGDYLSGGIVAIYELEKD